MANIMSYALAIRLSPIPIYNALLIKDGIPLAQTERQTQLLFEFLCLEQTVSVEADFATTLHSDAIATFLHQSFAVKNA